MAQPDALINNYLDVPERFANVINNGLFHGTPVIDPTKLTEGDSASRSTGKNSKVRDLIKKVYDNNTIFIIIGLENQTSIHYAMPLRIMDYDTRSYEKQRAEIQRIHEKKKDLSGDEWLNRFSKSDRLIPVITLVIYYGTRPWDGPRNLSDMLGIPEDLKPFQAMIGNYHMNLLEVMDIQNLESYNDDMKRVFGFVKYQRDKKALMEFVQTHNDIFQAVPRETVQVIQQIAHTDEILAYTQENAEVIDMCKALQDLKLEGQLEGELKGKLEIAHKLKERNLSIEEIVEITNLEKEAVLQA